MKMYHVGYRVGKLVWWASLPFALAWLAVDSGWRYFKAGFCRGSSGQSEG